jgi:hypothetical protein
VSLRAAVEGERTLFFRHWLRRRCSGARVVAAVLASPLGMCRLGLEGGEVARLWRQFPPVQIWRHRRATP